MAIMKHFKHTPFIQVGTRQRKERKWPLHRLPLFLLAAIGGLHSDEIYNAFVNASAKDDNQVLDLDAMIPVSSAKATVKKSKTKITTVSETTPAPDNRAFDSSRPPKCTEEQRSKMLKQLGTERCNNVPPWYQRCSFTRATRVTDSAWLKSYYETLYTKKGRIGSSGGSSSSSNKFVAIFVGCDKGYEAVDALRMGTGDTKYNKNVWAEEIKDTNESSVPARNEFQLGEKSTTVLDNDDAIVHCIEPASATATLLQDAASNLGWNDRFFVTNSAISNEVGEQYFKKPDSEVDEMRGSGDEKCEDMKIRNPDSFEKYCNTLHSVPLDFFLQETTKMKLDGRVQLLRISAQGFDYEVLLGAMKTLAITEYLEFKYHWTGSWQNYNLLDAVKMLDGLGFTCYFGGTGNVWRIDDSCWLDHFAYRTWANVACANRLLNKQVAHNMEETFLKTLEKDLAY